MVGQLVNVLHNMLVSYPVTPSVLIAEAIARISKEESVSSLFD
jgi:phosphoribosylpyrophosphate synthetase